MRAAAAVLTEAFTTVSPLLRPLCEAVRLTMHSNFFLFANFFQIQYYTYSQYSNPLRAQKFRNNNAFVKNFATHLWFFIALFFLFLTHFEAGAY